MKKQLEIFDSELNIIRQAKDTHSVILMGSVAYGLATEDSDLDILVLCDKDEFVTKTVNGILVEIHYQRYKTLRKELETNPMDVYKYIYSKIIFDDGKFAKLFNEAMDIYNNYVTPEDEKENIIYWLSSTKIKLLSAIKSNDIAKASFLVATNTWKVLEGVWAINNKPMPPSSLAYNTYEKLNFPLKNWFDNLFIGDTFSRARTMITMIDLIINLKR